MTAEKVAVVIGAGSGIGADAARRLASDGFNVALLTSSGKGEALAETLGGTSVTGSNRSADDIERICTAALERWGRIDVLVNSAGHAAAGAVSTLTDADWHEALETYLLNVVRAARVVLPAMTDQGGGAIINISSFAAFEPDIDFPTSGAMRAALANFTKLFSDQHGAENIRMNNVMPGFIDTFEIEPARAARIPLGRYGRVEEVSALISWLASEDGSYMTGQNIHLDGGMTRST